MCDEGSANYKAIEMEYGNDFTKERVVEKGFNLVLITFL